MNETNNNTCSECGGDLEPKDIYCNTCGAKVAVNTTPSVINGNGTPQYNAPTNCNIPPYKPYNSTLKACSITIIILLILSSMMAIMFYSQREKARAVICLSNVKQLGLAMLLYETDNDYMLPPANNWENSLAPYVENPKAFSCKKKHSYALMNTMPNVSFANIGLDEMAKILVLYPAPLGVTQGNQSDCVYVHNNKACVAFADGHAEAIEKK